MKRQLFAFIASAACAALVVTRGFAADAGYVEFGKFLPSDAGGKFVEVNIKENMLNFAATLAKAQEPDVAKLIAGLKQVRVNVIGVDDKNRADVTERIGKIRADLEARGWERTVTVRDNGDDIAIFVKGGSGNTIEGLVVTVLGRNEEAVLLNIVGNVDPNQIATIAAKFNIPHLQDLPALCPQPAPKPAPTPAAS